MPRPTNKSDLIAAADTRFAALWALIDTLSEAQQHGSFAFGADFLQKQKEAHWHRDKNIRDVLVHLHEWHRLLLNWINENRQGRPRPFLPPPYNWETYPQMNAAFWAQHQNTPYLASKTMLKASHVEVVRTLMLFSDEELFGKKHFSWTGTTTLGSYCVSATASHYDWAIKKINAHIRWTGTPANS